MKAGDTVAAIVAAHRSGATTPEADHRGLLRAHPRARRSGHLHLAAGRSGRAGRGQGARRHRPRRPAALRRAGRGEGQHRRRGTADHGGLPGLRLSARRRTRPASRGSRRAGAIVIGKTNLDQFATGLVGVRSPYGVPRNPFDPALIPGGSSSGSAVAVAAGLVPLALGTDTAGSGRVPAALSNIVGLKPSLGLVSTAGVVPACRTLDCVSVFALTVDDAFARARRDGRPRCRPIPIRARIRSARSGALPRGCGSACRCRASGCSSATRRRPRPTMRRSRASPRLGADDRGDRHRAVLRDRAAALRRAVGGRALHRRPRR